MTVSICGLPDLLLLPNPPPRARSAFKVCDSLQSLALPCTLAINNFDSNATSTLEIPSSANVVLHNGFIRYPMLKNVTIGNVSHPAISSPCVNRQPATGRTVALCLCLAQRQDNPGSQADDDHSDLATLIAKPQCWHAAALFAISRKMPEGQWEVAQ